MERARRGLQAELDDVDRAAWEAEAFDLLGRGVHRAVDVAARGVLQGQRGDAA